MTRSQFVRDVDQAKMPCDIRSRASERVRRIAIRAACQQHAGRREQGVHGAGMQRGNATLVGVFDVRAGVEQHR